MNQADWDEYINVLNEYHQDAFQQDIIWNRKVVINDTNGEDSNERTLDIALKGLVGYNHFRSWPINKVSEAGELDKESLIVYFNLEYLNSLGYTNARGQFKFNPGTDKFTLRGVTYKPLGDSEAAQAHDKPVFCFIILKREELTTGQERY